MADVPDYKELIAKGDVMQRHVARTLKRAEIEIESSTIRMMRLVEPFVFIQKLLVLILWMSCGIFFIHEAWFPGSIGVGIVLLGLGYAHALELVHSCVHCTATGVRRIDKFLGCVLSWPMLVSFYAYFEGHHRHHRNVGTTEDFESFSYSYQLLKHRSRLVRLSMLLIHCSMIRNYVTFFKRIALASVGRLRTQLSSERPGISERLIQEIEREHYMLLLVTLLLCICCCFGMGWEILIYWILPVGLIAGPIHFIVELPEHLGTDFPCESVLLNTREIVTHPIIAYFVNYNNHHGLHHLDGCIPMEKLVMLKSEIPLASQFKYNECSYSSYYWKFAAKIWMGPI